MNFAGSVNGLYPKLIVIEDGPMRGRSTVTEASASFTATVCFTNFHGSPNQSLIATKTGLSLKSCGTMIWPVRLSDSENFGEIDTLPVAMPESTQLSFTFGSPPKLNQFDEPVRSIANP